MSYVVTVSSPCAKGLIGTRTTVATLDAARHAVAKMSPLPEATATWVFAEAGGSLELEDGTVIQVEYVPDVTVQL